jgi:hypothetical protein
MPKRFSYDHVKACFEKRNYILLSSDYVNVVTKLKYECPEGHVRYITFREFIAGCGCSECSGNRKLTLEYVRKIFKMRGYTLLSTEYLGNKAKLKYECPKGHIGYIKFNNFQQGAGCMKCSLDLRRLTVEQVKQEFRNRGYEPLFDEYITNRVDLKYKCSSGHLCYITYSSFKQGCGCAICSKGPVSKISQVWLDQKDKLPSTPLLREHPLVVNGKKYSVDGYNPLTRTIYEFLGDFWHGNPARFKPENINPMNKKSYGQLRKETFERFATLEAEGYNVVYIWEKDFREQQNPTKK